jgi:hypothetical protein
MTELALFHAISSRGLIVHWMLEELNVPYELHILNLDAAKIPELITYWEGLAKRPAWQKVLETMP